MRSPSLLLLICAIGAPALSIAGTQPAITEAPPVEDPEVPFGFEAVTGYRSEYVYRGFKLGQHVIDFQLEAEVALTDSLLLSAGGWYATETSSGDFSEASGFIDLRYEWTHWALGVATSYHSFTHSFFESGLDAGVFATWAPTEDLFLTIGGYYDGGPDGWYTKLEGGWSHPIGDHSFISLIAGVSWVDQYYLRSGWNDAYARLMWTYNISDRVSITPFVGTSLSLDSKRGPLGGSDYLWGGLWFEVNF